MVTVNSTVVGLDANKLMASTSHALNNNNVKNMGREPARRRLRVDKDYPSLLPPDSDKRKWYFSLDELHATPSIKCGFPTEKELRERQKAASFIQDMGDSLKGQHGRADPRPRISQLCLCTAMVYMHRFYVFHSFTIFHPMDIGAACIFLAAKVEECPKKLESIVVQWHKLKYPKEPILDPKSDKFNEAAQLIVTLENILLLTLGFDLETQIPHASIIKGAQHIKAERSMTETAYWFASDILHLTSLCVRYRPSVIACVCIHLATSWANWEPPRPNGKDWWDCIDPDVTRNLLDGLSQEFVEVMQRAGDNLKMKSTLFVSKKMMEQSLSVPTPPLAVMPPPPLPPPPVKEKVDLSAYKERRAAGVAAASPASNSKRNNFMPDVNQAAQMAAKQAHVDRERKRHEERERQRKDREKGCNDSGGANKRGHPSGDSSLGASQPPHKQRRPEHVKRPDKEHSSSRREHSKEPKPEIKHDPNRVKSSEERARNEHKLAAQERNKSKSPRCSAGFKSPGSTGSSGSTGRSFASPPTSHSSADVKTTSVVKEKSGEKRIKPEKDVIVNGVVSPAIAAGKIDTTKVVKSETKVVKKEMNEDKSESDSEVEEGELDDEDPGPPLPPSPAPLPPPPPPPPSMHAI